MKRLTSTQIMQIKKLSRKHSLNTIYKHMGLGKSTVQYWYHKYGNPPVTKPITVDYSNKENIGEFIGAFAGDGSYTMDNGYRHQIRLHITAKDKLYVQHLTELIHTLFGRRPWIYTIEANNVTVLRILSVRIIKFVQDYLVWEHTKTRTVRLLDKRRLDKVFLTGFIRGLMDTDGYFRTRNKIAIFSTISEGLAVDIVRALKLFEIDHICRLQKDKRENVRPIYRIKVRSKDFEKFVSIIKPYHSNYI